jgi:RNA polymerase sigma-70 factor (ECF subfamily)
MLENPEAAQAELLHRIAAKDTEALAEFYDQTATPLYSLALRIVGDPGEAEEVIQDVFVQIWEKAPTFDPMLGSAFNWTLSIARHRSIDRLRARQRRARLIDELNTTEMTDGRTESESEEKRLAGDEAVGVRSALNGLPAEQRQVIELAFFGGRTHMEIAEALGQPLGTIKARIRRGLLKLRDSLQTYA